MSQQRVRIEQVRDDSNTLLTVVLANTVTLYNNVISNTLVATQNNWSPIGMVSNTNCIILNTNGLANITGINTGNMTLGLPVLLYNNSNSVANNITFYNKSSLSASANQMSCPGGSNVVLGPQYSVEIVLISTSPALLIFK